MYIYVSSICVELPNCRSPTRARHYCFLHTNLKFTCLVLFLRSDFLCFNATIVMGFCALGLFHTKLAYTKQRSYNVEICCASCSISWEMYPKLTSESVRQEQEELDIRTLHLLRATVHNEERKLPENWEENPAEHKK